MIRRIVGVTALMSVLAMLTACAAQQVIQPAAKDLAWNQVAVIGSVFYERGNPASAYLEHVDDAAGNRVADFGSNLNGANTLTVVPGRYEVTVSCETAGGNFTAKPSAFVNARPGYNYTFRCKVDGLVARIELQEVPSTPPR